MYSQNVAFERGNENSLSDVVRSIHHDYQRRAGAKQLTHEVSGNFRHSSLQVEDTSLVETIYTFDLSKAHSWTIVSPNEKPQLRSSMNDLIPSAQCVPLQKLVGAQFCRNQRNIKLRYVTGPYLACRI